MQNLIIKFKIYPIDILPNSLFKEFYGAWNLIFFFFFRNIKIWAIIFILNCLFKHKINSNWINIRSERKVISIPAQEFLSFPSKMFLNNLSNFQTLSRIVFLQKVLKFLINFPSQFNFIPFSGIKFWSKRKKKTFSSNDNSLCYLYVTFLLALSLEKGTFGHYS